MTRHKLRIAVILGGIGGLTAARALLHRGLEVHIYQSSPELNEIGARIALLPNAMKALRSLDLEDHVRTIGQAALARPRPGDLHPDYSLPEQR